MSTQYSEIRNALKMLIEAIQFTPLGVHGIKAVDAARSVLERSDATEPDSHLLIGRLLPSWKIERLDDEIVVKEHTIGGVIAREQAFSRQGWSGIAETILFHLADALLSINQQQVAPGMVSIPRNVSEARAMALMGMKWLKDNAPDQLVDPVDLDAALRDAIAEALGEAYDCMRVWSAWGVGTMCSDDFCRVSDSDERLQEIVDAVKSVMTGRAEGITSAVADDNPVINHKEALELAQLKQHESNLARCYIQMCSIQQEPPDEQSLLEEGYRAAMSGLCITDNPYIGNHVMQQKAGTWWKGYSKGCREKK